MIARSTPLIHLLLFYTSTYFNFKPLLFTIFPSHLRSIVELVQSFRNRLVAILSDSLFFFRLVGRCDCLSFQPFQYFLVSINFFCALMHTLSLRDLGSLEETLYMSAICMFIDTSDIFISFIYFLYLLVSFFFSLILSIDLSTCLFICLSLQFPLPCYSFDFI